METEHDNVVCLATFRQQKEEEEKQKKEREEQEYMEYLQAWAKHFAEEFPPDIVGMFLSLEEHLAGERK